MNCMGMLARSTRKAAATMAACVGLAVLAGCADVVPDSVSVTNTENVSVNPATAYGKVIDVVTRQGVAGATVSFKVGGTWVSTTTSGATASSPDDTTGDWRLTSLAPDTNYQMVVRGPSASTYVTLKTSCGTGSFTGPVNNQVLTNCGTQTLETGKTLTVFLVSSSDGSSITSPATIYRPRVNAVMDDIATRDATVLNKYTLVVENSFSGNVQLAPIDTNADGTPEFQARSILIGSSVVDADLTRTVSVSPVTSTTTLSLVDTNFKRVGDNSGGTGVDFISATDPIRLFFNLPVTPYTTTATDNSATINFTDRLKALTVATAPAVLAEVALTSVAQDAANPAGLVITPAAALDEQQTYTIVGTVRHTGGSATDPVTAIPTQTVRVHAGDGATGSGNGGAMIGSATVTPDIVLDNGNFCTNGTQIVIGDAVVCNADGTSAFGADTWLFFPERVWGTFRIISQTFQGASGAVTTIINGGTTDITGQAINATTNGGQNGVAWSSKISSVSVDLAANSANGFVGHNYTGKTFRRSAGLGLQPDQTGTSASSFMIGLDIYDSTGNAYRAERSFVVN